MQISTETNNKKSGLSKFLDKIERVGNRLPHPSVIFIILSVIIMIISAIAEKKGLNVTFTMVDKVNGGTKKATVEAVSLLNADGIRYMFTNAVKNFTGFAPLGTVLVAMLGVGIAEETGLIQAVMRRVIISTPKKLITVMTVFLGVISNVASAAGYIVLVPLGALMFAGFGRHPLAGIAAAFAGVSGGFSANVLVGSIDPLLGGISEEAAKLFDPSYTVTATANYYFMFASAIMITIVGTFITEKIVEPRLGKYEVPDDLKIRPLTDAEKKGLKNAGIAFILFVIAIALLIVPQNGILRNPETGEILGDSPFMDAIVPIISLFFLIPGAAYGIASGSIENDKDLAGMAAKAMAGMSGYLVLVFFASQFVAYFKYTNLGTILAVKGADFLEATGFTGIPLIILFVFVSAFINLFMGSASAKWAIMAPVFVPMLMKIGYSPEFTQVAYRIGDSSTNIITPLMSYFALIVSFAEVYDKKAGIGTLISTMIPYSVAFLLTWTLLLVLWFVLNLPLGPGSFIHMVLP